MKKTLALFLALIIVFSCLTTASFADSSEEPAESENTLPVYITTSTPIAGAAMPGVPSISDSFGNACVISPKDYYTDIVEMTNAFGHSYTIEEFKSDYTRSYSSTLGEQVADYMWSNSYCWVEKNGDDTYTQTESFELGKTYTLFVSAISSAEANEKILFDQISEYQDAVNAIVTYKVYSDAANEYYELCIDEYATADELAAAKEAFDIAYADWQNDTAGRAQYDTLRQNFEKKAVKAVELPAEYFINGNSVSGVDCTVITEADGEEIETEVQSGLIFSYDYLVTSSVVSNGICGENITWTLSDDGVLTISGTGEMTNFVGSANVPWYSSRESIKKIMIEYGVTSIGECAFSGGCKNLTNISIPNSITTIEGWAFPGCTGLTSITIPNSVTSIGERAFQNCTSLKSISIPNSVTRIEDWTFNNCTDLTSVTIPNSVKNIDSFAFYECTSLTNITIPDSVTSIGDRAFCGCTGLKSVAIPDSMTSIDNWAFYGCTGLTSITVDENNKYYSNDEYGVLFNKGKTKLVIYPIGNKRASYTIPNSVKSIGNSAFENCKSLTSITISDSVTSIGERAFENCKFLTSITVPNSVTSIGESAFSGCTGLESAGPVGSGCNYEFEWIDKIPSYAFYQCRSLTSVTIPDSVTNIGNYAFSYCSGLTSIIIPGSVTNIGSHAFYWCSDLASVTIPDSVTNIGDNAFYWCFDLTSVTIPDSVTSIGNSAFGDCGSLISITVDENSNNYSNDEYGVLFNKNKTELIQYPTGNKRTLYVIPNSVTSIGDYAFYGCNSLTSISIPDSVTSIGKLAFYECDELKSIHIPSGVTNIESNAFGMCLSLKYICSDSENSAAKAYAQNNGFDFKLCNGHNAVSYNANGGTGVPAKQIKDTDIDLILSNAKPKRDYYDFMGWATSPTAEVPEYQPGDTYSENADITLYAVWQISKYSLKITYKMTDGTDAPEPYTDELTYNMDYSVNSPAITGYTADVKTVSGKMDDVDGKNITVTYTPDNCKLIIHYIYENGSKAADDYIDDVAYNSIYHISSPEIAHFLADNAVVEGVMKNTDGIEVTVTYKVNNFGLTINYVDEKGDIIADPYAVNIDGGEYYSVASPEIIGYSIKDSAQTAVSGTMGTEQVMIYVVYTKNSYKLTVNYEMADGSAAPKAYTADVEYSSIYEVVSPTVAGYTPDISVVRGTMGAELVDVTVTYSPNKFAVTWVIDGKSTEQTVTFGKEIVPPASTKQGFVYTWIPEVPETMPAENLTFTGTLCRDYSFDTDRWSFGNYSEKLDDKYTDVFYSPAQELFLRNGGYINPDNNKPQGHCFGMSMSTASILMGKPSADRFIGSSAQNLYDVDKNDTVNIKTNVINSELTAEDFINYAQAYQFLPDIQNQMKSNEGKADNLRKAVHNYYYGESTPIVIGFISNSGNHAVFAVSIKETDSKNFTIYINDSNYPDTLGEMTFNNNGWEYTVNGNVIYSSQNKDSFSFVKADEFYRKLSESLSIEIATLNYVIVNVNKTFSPAVSNVIGTIRINLSFDADTAEIDESDEELYWVPKGTDLEFSNTSEEKGKVSFAGDEYILSADISPNGSANITFDGATTESTVALTDSEEYEVSYSYLDSRKEITTVVVSGNTSDGNAEISYSADEIVISGCSDCTVQIIEDDTVVAEKKQVITDKNSEVSLIISTQDDKINVTENKKAVKIDGYNEEITIKYKTDITFHSTVENMPENTSVNWYVDGTLKDTGKDFSVWAVTKSFTVQAKIVDNSGNVIAQSGIQKVDVKNSIFDRIIWFIMHIFLPGNYKLDQK